MVSVGVIGAGLMGTTHARTLATAVPGAELTAISDTVSEQAERLAHEVAVDRVYGDAPELIHDPGVDAVIIASTAPTHEEFALACLQAGKPVLCEKPLAATAAAARQVLDAEAALGRRLVQVGFMRRFDPGYRELKAALDGGAIGAPLIAYSTHRAPTVPDAFDSEMVITDTVVHDVDTIRWMLGQEMTGVTVLAGRPTSQAPAGVHDPQMVVFECSGGVLVHVEAFVRAQYGYDIRCEVVGEAGTLTLSPPATALVHRDGHATVDLPQRFQERFADAYIAELTAWIASIADGTPVGASAWDGHAATVICEAAVESQKTHRPVAIDLSDKPSLYAAQPEELLVAGH
ncbi:MAG: Gfo/Idh/MocA family oxidoreductase [Solirubrobacterales bacterium]|nr:Gfo/Idh/MocA family oxidoreductase [Solirubrobacterales bacterium]